MTRPALLPYTGNTFESEVAPPRRNLPGRSGDAALLGLGWTTAGWFRPTAGRVTLTGNAPGFVPTVSQRSKP